MHTHILFYLILFFTFQCSRSSLELQLLWSYWRGFLSLQLFFWTSGDCMCIINSKFKSFLDSDNSLWTLQLLNAELFLQWARVWVLQWSALSIKIKKNFRKYNNVWLKQKITQTNYWAKQHKSCMDFPTINNLIHSKLFSDSNYVYWKIWKDDIN